MFEKLIQMIKKLYNFIMDLIFRKKKKRQPRKDNSNNETYDNINWCRVTSKKNKEKQDDQYSPSVKIPKDIYGFKSDKVLEIKFPILQELSNETYFAKVDRNNYINLISDEDFHCLYPSITVSNTTVKIFVSHALMLTDSDTKSKASMVNPQVYMIPKPKLTLPTKWHKQYHEANIYTKEIGTMADYIITCKPLTHINTMYQTKPKPKMGTIALTFNLPNDKEMFWSGSLVRYQKSIFIVGMTSLIEDYSIIKIIAYSVTTHDITIEINDEEER